MANLPITITISTPAPLSSRDLPKFMNAARTAATAAGLNGTNPALSNDGTTVNATFTGTIR